MDDRDALGRCHPAVSFLYFAEVLAVTMFLLHPAAVLVSLLGAAAYRLRLGGGRGLRAQLVYLLPMMALAALVNVLFNHRGATVLARLPGGSPLTLESLGFALSAAGMLAAVVIWFGCYDRVMTADKFTYLFGRVIPALSLVLSMTLRAVPRFRDQFRAVSEARRCVGRGLDGGKGTRRVKNGAAILSAMLTWSLENGVETADSMKSRGYGLPGRGSFSLWRFTDRDGWVLLWLAACGFYILCGWGAGALSWSWYPALSGAPVTPLAVSVWGAWLGLCLTPVILNGREDLAWRRLRSGT